MIAPGSREICCQQTLRQDGSVYSVQSLLIPDPSAHQITAHLLRERYLRLIREFTFSLVRPVQSREGIQFRLAGTSLAFLSFDPPEYHCDAAHEAVHLPTVGGLLVRGGETARGTFSFLARREEAGVRVTVQLTYCRPLLLGSGTPSPVRRLLFSSTQGRIHRAITVRFLSELYRDVTGDHRQLTVRRVQAGEGRDI